MPPELPPSEPVPLPEVEPPVVPLSEPVPPPEVEPPLLPLSEPLPLPEELEEPTFVKVTVVEFISTVNFPSLTVMSLSSSSFTHSLESVSDEWVWC